MYAYSGHPLYKGRTRSRNCSTEECVHVHGLSYLPTILHAAWDKERWLALRQIGDPLADSALEAGLGYHKGRVDINTSLFFVHCTKWYIVRHHSFEINTAFA